MIVTEKEVEAALEFKGDSDRAAELSYKLGMAKVSLQEALDRAYLAINDDATVREKEARSRLDVSVMKAGRDLEEASAEWVRFKTMLSKADAIIETWRTESANARGMEMVR
jgi:hypothetical protein